MCGFIFQHGHIQSHHNIIADLFCGVCIQRKIIAFIGLDDLIAVLSLLKFSICVKKILVSPWRFNGDNSGKAHHFQPVCGQIQTALSQLQIIVNCPQRGRNRA